MSSWKRGTEPRPDAVRKAAKAYHTFVNVGSDELLRQLLRVAYVPEREKPKHS